MANKDNLKKGNPDTQFKTGRKQVEIARKAGIASGKAKREKKAMRETLEELLAMPIKDGASDDIEKIKSIAGIKGKNITMQEAIMVAMLNKAAKGDVRAAEYVRDTIGQKPTDKLELNNRIEIDEKINEIEEYIKLKGKSHE